MGGCHLYVRTALMWFYHEFSIENRNGMSTFFFVWPRSSRAINMKVILVEAIISNVNGPVLDEATSEIGT